eukprot:8018893-Karenia_brevis.AAC.1
MFANQPFVPASASLAAQILDKYIVATVEGFEPTGFTYDDYVGAWAHGAFDVLRSLTTINGDSQLTIDCKTIIVRMLAAILGWDRKHL